MTSKPEKRYLLPANANPDTDRCVIVFIPDAPEYLRAFMGSLTFLGTWTAWERDPDHRAMIASQRWKQANMRTLQTLDILDCELIEELIEDGDMSINVNNNISCGGCGDCGQCLSPTSTYSPTPEQPQPDSIPPLQELPDTAPTPENFPPEFPSFPAYQEYRCAVSRQIAIDMRNTFSNMQTFSGLVGMGAAALAAYIASSSVVAGLVTGLLGVGLLSAGAVWAIVGVLVGFTLISLGMFAYMTPLYNSIVIGLDELTCIIYSGNTTAEIKANITSFFESRLAGFAYENTIEEGVFTISILKILDYLLPADLFGLLNGTVTELEEFITAEAGTFNCALCGDIGVLGAWVYDSSTGSDDPNLTVHSVGTHAWSISGSMNRQPVNFEQLYLEAIGASTFDFDDVFAVGLQALSPITPAPNGDQGVRWGDNGPNIGTAFQAGESILVYLTGQRPASIPAHETEVTVGTHAALYARMRIEWTGGSSPFDVSGGTQNITLYDVNGDPIA